MKNMRRSKLILADHIVITITVKAKIKRKTIQTRIKNNKMKKKNKIITVFATAAITFLTLWITLGEEKFNRGNKHYHDHWAYHHHCDNHDDIQHETNE